MNRRDFLLYVSLLPLVLSGQTSLALPDSLKANIMPLPKEHMHPCPVFGRFGKRLHPLTRERDYTHLGMDIICHESTKVYTVLPGRVSKVVTDAKETTLTGNEVIVRHAYDEVFYTQYCHLQTANVKKGDTVIAGDLLGLVGHSGRSSPEYPHLHFAKHYWTIKKTPYQLGDAYYEDPSSLLGMEVAKNMSAGKTVDDVVQLCKGATDFCENYKAGICRFCDQFKHRNSTSLTEMAFAISGMPKIL